MLVRVQRFSHMLNGHRLGRPFARAIEIIVRVVWSAHIPPGAKVARTAQFGHNGLSVIVHPFCEIGENCLIGPQVVLGGKAPIIGAPIIEDSVIIHAGAKVFGRIRIGAGSVIGANAVVMEDVPARSLVAGIPATVRKREIDVAKYR
jgi:serine O-acetyltransferase